ncbi:protein of unknown function [Nocardia cyriacigeorgica GUH-2]|uniref:Uncharacterized protein n=1 Tax=Nocardia cyriacigeorgica (strain GUH-2) TaxID=1127134 RepID=H6RA84_NOCCG|nr:protein of unknown function [Nocardia cyriacigeorgica GUH-2]
MRPCITNNSSGELDLGITKTADKSSAMRLLVNAKDLPGSWNPPPATAAAGDRPVQVSWQGHTYWAIPANVPHDAVEVPVIENGQQIGTTWDGFSTIWEDVKLTPENRILYEPIEYGANGWPIQETDLVFNLPGSDASELTIFALAIVDRTNPSIVIAVSPAFDPGGAWPENQWAAYF